VIATAVLTAAMHPLPYWNWIKRRRAPAAVQSRVIPPGPQFVVVGHEKLYPCNPVVPGYCGLLQVPLNWLNPSEGSIKVRFE
jgi:hypothetical protein